jgi:hypothetical protein
MKAIILETCLCLFNIVYDKCKADQHVQNDGIVENEIRNNLHKVVLYTITIKNEDDLIQNIARIARKAKDLGFKLKKKDRDMCKREAYEQLSDSASLFKAVLEYVNYSKTP